MRIGDEPITPAEVVAAARGGPIDVELSASARERIARSREVADAIASVLRDGPLLVLRDLGGIGTGDVTLLAQLGLALAGEGEWTAAAAAAAGSPPRIEIEAGDALALMSSNAATDAAAALAWADSLELLDAGLGIGALTFHALEGNRQAFAPAVAAAHPLPGLAAVSRGLRALTDGAPAPAR